VLGGGYAWSQNQYYVADDGPYVAIFRGVQTDIPLVSLSHTYRTENLKVADLNAYGQDQVRSGIVAGSLSEARRIVANLANQKACKTTEPSTSSTKPSSKPSPKASASSAGKSGGGSGSKAGSSAKSSGAHASSKPSAKASASPKSGSGSSSSGSGSSGRNCGGTE
jgi:protein phosphatase